eukprot:Em0004g241a
MISSSLGAPNPNALWLNSRGMWLGYILMVAFLHFLLMSVPFLTTGMAWTLTHLIHNVGNYVMFHYLKGTPYTTNDQGDARRLTNWEQIDNGEQYTATRKFLIAVPVVLFLLASFYTINSFNHSVVNLLALCIGVLPKLPHFHRFRLFGINKY